MFYPKMLREEARLRNKGFTLVAGIDEAGRGPLAGPVVAACCILKGLPFTTEVNDSKLLSPKKRETAYREIILKTFFSIGIVKSDLIDKINIYNATKLAMEKAVKNLSLVPDYLLIDGNISLPNISIPQKLLIKGDSRSLSIASASIIAKVTRDRIMAYYHEYFPHFGFFKHKGYGTREHYRVLKYIGPSLVHRRSFNLISKENRHGDEFENS